MRLKEFKQDEAIANRAKFNKYLNISFYKKSQLLNWLFLST